jgi:hypothetical protein
MWEKFKASALEHGLQACWSYPISTAFNSVLGTVDVYYRHRHSPVDEWQP